MTLYDILLLYLCIVDVKRTTSLAFINKIQKI